MKFDCQFENGILKQVDWYSFYRNQEYVELKSLDPIPFELEKDKFLRLSDKGQIIFEGYVSEFSDNSFKLIGYYTLLKQDIK